MAKHLFSFNATKYLNNIELQANIATSNIKYNNSA